MRLCKIVPTGLLLLHLSSALNGSFIFSRSRPFHPSFAHVFSHYNSFPPVLYPAFNSLLLRPTNALLLLGRSDPIAQGICLTLRLTRKRRTGWFEGWKSCEDPGGEEKMAGMQWRKRYEGKKGEHVVRCRGGRRRSGASVRPTSAVATGNLIYLMSSWLLFHLDCKEHKKNIALSPLCSLSSFSFLLLSFLKSVNTHLSCWFSRCSIGAGKENS